MNVDVPSKMSRVIYNKGGLVLRFHVKIMDMNGKFYHNEFEYNKESYLSLNPNVYLTLEVTRNKDETFDPSKSVLITSTNLYVMIRSMKRFLKEFYDEPIFANKGKHIIMYPDIAKKASTIIQFIGTVSQVVSLTPAVGLFDDIEYESVEIQINNTDNSVIVPIDEFETVIYLLSKIDLFQYSQLLLNYFASYYGKISYIKKQEMRHNKAIDWTSEKKDTDDVVANFRPPEKTIINGLDILSGV